MADPQLVMTRPARLIAHQRIRPMRQVLTLAGHCSPSLERGRFARQRRRARRPSYAVRLAPNHHCCRGIAIWLLCTICEPLLAIDRMTNDRISSTPQHRQTTTETRTPRSATAPSRASTAPAALLDRDSLDAFRRREPVAVRALYREFGRLVYAVAHRVLGRHDLAEDAVQETFVRAWQAADRFDAGRDPAAWLATIAKRAAIDIHRREARRTTGALADVAAADHAVVSLPPELGTFEAVWHVRRAIDQPEVEEATIVRLQHLEGMTHAAISERLGIPLGTVKSRSHRAHRKLATQLGHLRSWPA